MADGGAGGILIVGGGIAGLGLATALHRQGTAAEVVERNPDWRALGAGLLVQGNGMRVLGALGLDEAVRAAGIAVRRWVIADQRGETLCEVDLEALWSAAGPCVGVTRAGLQRALRRAAAGVPCRLGTTVTSLTGQAGRVVATFSDGSAGAYDLVVGADGIHSDVRRYVAPAAVVFGGQMVWRSLAPLPLSAPPSVQFWLGDGCFFGLCATGEGTTYGFGNATLQRRHDPPAGRLERLRRRFAAFGDAVQQYLARLDSDGAIHCSPVEWIERPVWRRGRIVLIGDAAHAASPMLGQGGSLALEDAAVLAECLRAAPDVEDALAAYEARRHPRVEWVRRQSLAAGESLRLPPEARDAVLRRRGAAALRERFGPLVAAP